MAESYASATMFAWLRENGFGVVFPQLFGRETALAETRATLEGIGRFRAEAV